MFSLNRIVDLIKQPVHRTEVHLRGGVHPDEHKHESTQQPIMSLPIPHQIVLPLRQHVGHLPKLLVKVGERVKKGQLLAEAEGSISAAIHATTSGTVIAVQDSLIPHPSGLPDQCIVIAADGLDEWVDLHPMDWRQQSPASLIEHLRLSGIVGMGGAAFPTQVKLRTTPKSPVHTLIVNGAECEPYITCDDMLMRERATLIIQGLAIARHIMGVENCIIGIEDNKPEALQAMTEAAAKADFAVQVKVVATMYPSGDARQLIRLLTGMEVPNDKRSTDVGLQCFNVATLLALHRYFDFGEPAVSRIVTMTGRVNEPRNYEVLFGTPMTDLIAASGGALSGVDDYIMGGPMMGFSLPSIHVPVTKASNCIIASAPDLFPPAAEAMPCIRCARCADACPVQLQPQELYWFAKSENIEKAREYHLFDCIECGCCSYVCPSNISLVQYYRFAKSEAIAQDRAKEAANVARERNEFRLMRIDREKQERAQRHAQKALGSKDSSEQAPAAATNTEDAASKQAAIQAAIERAKAQKAQMKPKNVEDAPTQVKAEIAEIDARREQAKQAVTQSQAQPAAQQASLFDQAPASSDANSADKD